MLYIDKNAYSKTVFAFRFNGNRDYNDVWRLTDTHVKSFNWDEVDDGLWENLIIVDN